MTDDQLISALKAAAHPVRLRILRALSGKERNVTEIDQLAQIGQPTLSQQLAVLRNGGLVLTRKEAKLVYYRLDKRVIAGIVALLGSIVEMPLTEERPPEPRSSGAANFARLT